MDGDVLAAVRRVMALIFILLRILHLTVFCDNTVALLSVSSEKRALSRGDAEGSGNPLQCPPKEGKHTRTEGKRKARFDE